MKIRRFFTWLVRPQYTALAVICWFILGNVAASGLPQWAKFTAAVALGAGQVLLTRLVTRLLHRRDHEPSGL